MTILDQIFEHKADEVDARKKFIPVHEMRARAEAAPGGKDFLEAIRRKSRGEEGGERKAKSKLALIAELKKASPSQGVLRPDFDHMEIAKSYIRNGAACLSVLTDEKYFQGSLGILGEVALLPDRVPILEKDFILDPYQVYEARAFGADAVLLIAAKLDDGQISELAWLAGSLGMAALVETHDAAELGRVSALALPLIGINNRNLRDMTIRRETCLELAPMAPEDCILVAESGIKSPEDRRRIEDAGFDAILVGETLVTAPDPGYAVGNFAS